MATPVTPDSGRLHHAAKTLKYPTQQHQTMHPRTAKRLAVGGSITVYVGALIGLMVALGAV